MNLTIHILALPPKEASPNWRGHWAQRYKANQTFKALAKLMAQDALRAKGYPEPMKAATLSPTIVVPDRRYMMDGDNAIATLKGAIDGITLAGVVNNDKNITVLPVKYEVDKHRTPELILELEER